MNNEVKKEIGLIKWFRNESKNANYGFIEHANLGDLTCFFTSGI
jgi:hypothetical protein